MRTVDWISTEYETCEQQTESRRCNPAKVMRYRDKRGIHEVTLDHGSNDELHLFREGEYTLVLSVNRRVGYTGLQILNGEGEESEGVFLQSDHEVESVLGKLGLDLEPINIAKALFNSCQ